jgi:putative SOS response-associated peptidase YedK
MCQFFPTSPAFLNVPLPSFDPDVYELWLDPGMTNVAAVSDLLKPYDARLMRCYPVSTRINHVAKDDAECSAPVEPAQTQDRLFS